MFHWLRCLKIQQALMSDLIPSVLLAGCEHFTLLGAEREGDEDINNVGSASLAYETSMVTGLSLFEGCND